MKGNLSRDTFRPEHHFAGVRLQQGRVQVDADWNEQVDIEAHRDDTTAADVIGPCGVPWSSGGFAVGMLPLRRRLRGAAASGPTTAMAVGDAATVLATTGGGSTWARQSPPTGVAATLRAVAASSATTALAVGDGATILATSDGGGTWVSQAGPEGVTETLRGIDTAGATAALAVGDATTIVSTTNGGATWAAQAAPAGVTATLRAVAAAGPLVAWAVGDAATILATTDGGAAWVVQAPPDGATENLRAVAASGTATAVAVGDDGTILATVDGGAEWVRQTPPAGVTATLRAVAAASPLVAWAVGDDATVLATTDGGVTWSAQSAPIDPTAGLRAVTAAGPLVAWAVGDDGAIVATTDGGASWSSESGPSELSVGGGRIYVGGILCENEATVAVADQPDPPVEPLPDPSDPGQEGATFLAYLDVWERHLTAVERPELREVALGGPDTATRARTVWQVRLAASSEAQCDLPPGWAPPGEASTGRLAARSTPAAPLADPCLVPPGAGFRGLENQLYRVEIRQSGPAGTATFTWSRENGSVLARLERVEDRVLTISGLEKDAVVGFTGARFVEVSDEERTLGGGSGDLVELDSAQAGVLTMTAAATLSPRRSQPTVRRWEAAARPVPTGAWVELEDGVEVRFTPGRYRTGDHWLIPARTVTGDVEWHRDDDGPRFERRHGIDHHYCALGLLAVDAGSWTLRSDCRHLFPPLGGLSGLFHGGGDGQESLPGEPLPQPLLVWAPVAGARVRFRADRGGVVAPTVADLPAATADTLVVTTGDDRAAACAWRLEADVVRPTQRLEATLLDGAGNPTGVHVVFTGGLSLASQVAYDPSACAGLAGTATVQEAIDRLCQREEDEGIHVLDLVLPTSDAPLRNDATVSIEELRQGIALRFDREVASRSVVGKPTCFVTVEMPYPITETDRRFWDSRIIGSQPVVLAAGIEAPDGPEIRWVPPDEVLSWLGRLLDTLSRLQEEPRVLARLTLKGNFIWAPEDRSVWLDGEAFGVPARDGRTELLRERDGRRSGDGRRGGDFEMWFWLGAEASVRLEALTVEPANIVAGAAARGVVALVAPSQEPVRVLLRSSAPIVAVPDSVDIQPGTRAATFPVRSTPVPGAGPLTVTLLARLGQDAVTTTLIVRPAVQ